MNYILVTFLNGLQQVLVLESEEHGICHVHDDQGRSGMFALSSTISVWSIEQIEYDAMLKSQKHTEKKSGLLVPKV